MNDSKPIDRREFTLHSAMAILGGVAISVSGCDSDSPAAPTPPAAGDETGTVGTNHSHSAVITAAQLAAGDMISLDIRGTATHGHTVELSAERDHADRGRRARQQGVRRDERSGRIRRPHAHRDVQLIPVVSPRHRGVETRLQPRVPYSGDWGA